MSETPPERPIALPGTPADEHRAAMARWANAMADWEHRFGKLEPPTVKLGEWVTREGPACNCTAERPHTVGDPGCVVEIPRGPSDECRPSAPCAACSVKLGHAGEPRTLRDILFGHRALAGATALEITELMAAVQPLLGPGTEHQPELRIDDAGNLLPEQPFDPAARYLVSGAVVQSWIDTTNRYRDLLTAAAAHLGDDQ